MIDLSRLAARIVAIHERRPPDFIVGGADHPYLRRWYLTPWRRWISEARHAPTRWKRAKAALAAMLPSVYLHHFMRDDDDRALHDHPWFWCSVLLQGSYIEHTIAAGGIHRRRARTAGSVKFATPWRAHRVELPLDAAGHSVPCWTLFVVSPRLRNWGFHCEKAGWIPWQRFVDPEDAGKTGRGCGEQT